MTTWNTERCTQTPRRVLRLVLLAWLAACTDSGGDDVSDAAQVVADSAPADADGCPAPAIVYLNRNGGTYAPGPDDSVANTSSLLTSEVEAGDWLTNWDTYVERLDCIRATIAPYHIELVDTNPGEVDHLEIVATGSHPEDLGLGSLDSLGVVPYACEEPIRRNVAFVFMYDIDSRRQCDVAASMIALAVGIDETTGDPCDATYGGMDQCDGEYAFTDAALACAFNGEARNCLCTGEATENPHQLMVEAYGLVCTDG